MSTTASWVAEAINALSLADRVRRIDEPERSKVLRRVTDAFLERPDALFWWLHLRVPSEHWHTEHGYKHLPQLVPDPRSPSWLITGLEDEDKGVFQCTPAQATAIIGECPGFEYALVDSTFTWLVIENHHDVLIAAGSTRERLSRLRG